MPNDMGTFRVDIEVENAEAEGAVERSYRSSTPDTAVCDRVAQSTQDDGSWRLSLRSALPLVMSAEAVSPTAPLARAHRDPLVTCSHVSLPVPVRIGPRHTNLMLGADRIVAHLGHGVPTAGDACLA